jgi:RecB family endonuclease NucS
MDLISACEKIQNSIKNQEMCFAIGDCFVNYQGRASSKLPKGKRLLLIKADSSISIHENRLVRPTNYMISTKTSCEVIIKKESSELHIFATKLKPQKEENIEQVGWYTKLEAKKMIAKNSYPSIVDVFALNI